MSSNLTTTTLSLSGYVNDEMDLATNGSKTISVNSTQIRTDGHLVSDNAEDSDNGRQVIVAAALVIVFAITLICSLLCYREFIRRRLDAFVLGEFVRREEIKRTIQKKIAEMQNSDDSDSYVEKMKLKVPLVTFGDVTKISPAHSCEAIHLQAQLLHHHHHVYHHHHHHIHAKKVVVKGDSRLSVSQSGKEKHWRASPHRIPTTGRLLSRLFGNDKKRREEKRNEVMEL